MAFIIKDRVKESTTSTGTGAITLSGAAATFDTFQSYMTNGDTTYYAIVHTTSGVDEWEVGLGTWNTGNTLTRTTVLAGSNGTSAQDFAAGNKDVFMTYPAAHAALAEDDVTFDNITVTGTVDGRDVAADGTKLDTVEQNADVTDAVNVAAAGALMRAGGTMTGNLILNADPGAALGAATKQYVDTIASAGIHYHTPVRAEHPSNLNATYSNGSSGVGATLTNAGTNAALVIDSVSMVLNDRVLVANQTTQTQNGVYTVTTVGDGSTAWVLTRSTDTDTAAPSDPDAFGKGDAFFIKEGVTNAGHLDVLSTSGTIVFGTTNIVFSEVAETTVYSGGTGITLTGTTFAIGQDVGTTSNVTFNQVTAAIIGNVTGNVTGDVTGNAGTATALATARTVQLSGDVTGSASFDGSANINITAVVQDDSHSHVISNVDGLQTALDAKAPTSRTITAGNGLTGGGDLTANRTLTVGGGTGITVNANDIAIDSSYTGFDSRYVNTAGDTMTGNLVLEDSELHVGDTSNDSWTRVKHAQADSYGFNWQHDNATVIVNEQGTTNQALVLGDVDVGNNSGLFGISHSNVGAAYVPKLDLRGNGELYIGSSATSRVFHDGYHPNADKWTTARTLTLSGDASGSVSWDGSANATLSVAVVNDSHTHDTRYIQEGGTDFSGTYPLYFRTAARQAYSNGGITFTGSTDTLNVSGNINVSGNYVQIGPNNNSQYLYLGGSGNLAGANTAAISVTNGNLHMDSATSDQIYLNYYNGNGVAFGGGSSNVVAWMGSDGDLWKGSSDNSGSKYWHAGNDGSGSGLDADLLDGVQGSNYIRYDVNMTGTLPLDDHKIQFASGSASGSTFAANHYSMGVDIANGGWSGTNYSDLIIGYHTGIRIGAAYSGIRFYDNSPTTDTNNTGNGNGAEELLMTIGGGGSTTSGAHVTVHNNLTVQDDIDVGNRSVFGSDTATADEQNNVWMFASSVSSGVAQAGAFHNKLRILGGSGQSRDLQLYQVDSEYAHIGSSWSSNQLNIDSNFTLTTLNQPMLINDGENEKITLRGSNDPYIRWEQGTTDKFYIQWRSADGAPLFRNQVGDNFDFMPDAATGAINLRLRGSDNDIWGSVYADDNSNVGRVGFLDDDQSWAYRITSDVSHEWIINSTTEMSLSNSTLDMKGNTITEVEDIGLRDKLYHDGDTDTYLGFGTNTITLATGGSSEITVNTTGVRLGDTGNGYFQPVSGHYGSIQIDGGNHGGWEGYSIGGRVVFMHDNSTATGIFNDVNDEWLFYAAHNSYTRMYFNGVNRLETSTAGVTVVGNLNSTSDIRYKKNIETIDSALDKVQSLRGVTFEWDNDAFKEDETSKKPNFTGRATGVIAQDVEKVLPEAVSENEDGFKNVSYGNMVGLLIEAIKEQQAQIDELKTKLNS